LCKRIDAAIIERVELVLLELTLRPDGGDGFIPLTGDPLA
jgi:hypothetical protein